MRILKLGGLAEQDLGKVGGKAKGLDFLKKHGYRIAEGFVATDIEEEDGCDEIAVAFRELHADKVSVRSSATNEDGGEYSNAGQYETCLNVTEDGLEDAVEKCLGSLHNERATAYTETLLQENGASMNLVVEEMIDAKCAGVMFTVAPDEKENVLIESVDGLGENLVSGAVSAYRYCVPRTGFRFENNGNLSEELLKQIYTQGLEIARIYGMEADLEWAVDKNGELFWLQLRPITTLDEGSMEKFDSKNPLENHLVTTRNIGEMMPGAITPLSISTTVLAIDYGMRNMFKEIGAIKKVSDKPDYLAAFAIDNHLFIDLTALHGMCKQVIVASPQAMNLSVLGENYEPCPEAEGKKAFVLVGLWNSLRMAKYLFSTKKARRKVVEINDNLHFDYEKNARSLYEEITRKMPAMNEVLCYHYVCSSFSGSMNSALYMTLSKDFEDKAEYQAFISGILTDIDGIESADILASLREMARLILKENPQAAALTEDELLALVTDPNNGEIHARYLKFLKVHGHRSVKEAELRSKAWKNDPVTLMRNLHTVLVSGAQEEEKKEPFDIEKFLSKIKRSKRSAARWIGKRARQAVCDREFSKSNIIKTIDKFKDRYIELAKMMVEEGYLVDEDSIYFLSHEEIGALLGGKTSLKRKALLRRTQFKETETMSFPDIYVGRPKPLEEAEINGLDSAKGIPVCKGKVYGKARVVRSLEDAGKLEKGEIMVAPFTDIGWSPYYSLIGALITEVGSSLSHGAVVAREYALPTVVNVRNATKFIKTGDYLYVDANKGNVTVISEEEYLKNQAK